jgi:succinate-acetate transporter protein
VRGLDLLKPLETIYWIRVTLSIIAGGISAVVATFFESGEFNTFLNGVTVALAIYLISYYVLKAKFANRVEKQSKIMSMGIFIYFIAWAVFFILFYSILAPPL